MSKKKQTPAEVAQTLANYIARQEETLRSFPVGPLGNSARRNLQRGREALAMLQGQNEKMRMERDPAMQGAQMSTGGTTYERSLRNFNPGNLRKWGDQPIEDGFAVFETPEGQYRVYIGLKMGVGDANRLADYIAENATVDVDIDQLAEDAVKELDWTKIEVEELE